MVAKGFQRTKAALDRTEHPLGRRIAHGLIVLVEIALPDPSHPTFMLRLSQGDQAISDGLQVLAHFTKAQIHPGNAMEVTADRA